MKLTIKEVRELIPDTPFKSTDIRKLALELGYEFPRYRINGSLSTMAQYDEIEVIAIEKGINIYQKVKQTDNPYNLSKWDKLLFCR